MRGFQAIVMSRDREEENFRDEVIGASGFSLVVLVRDVLVGIELGLVFDSNPG